MIKSVCGARHAKKPCLPLCQVAHDRLQVSHDKVVSELLAKKAADKAAERRRSELEVQVQEDKTKVTRLELDKRVGESKIKALEANLEHMGTLRKKLQQIVDTTTKEAGDQSMLMQSQFEATLASKEAELEQLRCDRDAAYAEASRRQAALEAELACASQAEASLRAELAATVPPPSAFIGIIALYLIL